MTNFRFLCSEIWQGKSVTRAFYNLRLSREMLCGDVIDIGGGKNADYLDFMSKSTDLTFFTFDTKAGADIDFETDQLPLADHQYDTVLFLNVLEHIFNYQHITSEVLRILKPGGRLIGIVPFLMWYHPDPHDFFRYTDEALRRILEASGAQNIRIEPIAFGPFSAAAQMVTQSVPNFFALLIFCVCYLLDSIFHFFRPNSGKRYVLGYYFEVITLNNNESSI